MKTIKAYQGDCYKFHEDVIANKHHRPTDPTYKKRILELNPKIKQLFIKHDDKFSKDELAILIPEVFSIRQKEDLKSLYDYSTIPFIKLKTILTTDDNGHIQPLCPFCTINNSNTLDHLIPKTEFPEYSDNPQNLMPCCSECNSLKSTTWRLGNERKYLNLYLDSLPSKQYLFIELIIEDNTIKAFFNIENRENIENKLFNRILNHYTRFNLCEQFSQNSYNVISELKYLISSFNGLLQDDIIKDIIYKSAAKERDQYGWNYWKALLKIECCNNDIVFNYLLKGNFY